MPRPTPGDDTLPQGGGRSEPTDLRVPHWLVPNTLEEHRTDADAPSFTGSEAIVVAPGVTLTPAEAFQAARAAANGSRKGPLARLGAWLFLVLWVVLSAALVWGLTRTALQVLTAFTLGFFFLLSGAIVYPEVVEPLLRRLDRRSAAASPPSTEALIAQSSAVSREPRARFISDAVEEMVLAVHRAAPQRDAALHSAVWAWATTEDPAALAPIERLWKRADPEGYARFMAEVDDDETP